MNDRIDAKRSGLLVAAIVVLALATVTLVGGACGGSEDTSADGTEEPILVGGIVPLTGALIDEAHAEGLEIAVANLNASGGVLRINRSSRSF